VAAPLCRNYREFPLEARNGNTDYKNGGSYIHYYFRYIHTDNMVPNWSTYGIGSQTLHCTSLATFMVPLTLDGNKGDGAVQKFSKVHVSWPVWSSGEVLTNCRRAVGHRLLCQLLSNLYQ
jgi:hypothetical protein